MKAVERCAMIGEQVLMGIYLSAKNQNYSLNVPCQPSIYFKRGESWTICNIKHQELQILNKPNISHSWKNYRAKEFADAKIIHTFLLKNKYYLWKQIKVVSLFFSTSDYTLKKIIWNILAVCIKQLSIKHPNSTQTHTQSTLTDFLWHCHHNHCVQTKNKNTFPSIQSPALHKLYEICYG